MKWQLQDASDQFGKIVEQARTEGPQTVTAGEERVSVVLSAEDYDALRAENATLVDQLLTQRVPARAFQPRTARWARALQAE